MIRTGEAVKTVRGFFDAYFSQRDMEQALAYLKDDIQWISTDSTELLCGRKEAEKALAKEFAQAPEAWRIVYGKIVEKNFSEDSAAVFLTAVVYPKPGAAEMFGMRVSALCVKEDDICRIAAIHASTANRMQDDDGFFPSASLDRSDLEKQMSSMVLDIIGQNIPGGMLGRYLGSGHPLYYVNDFMLEHLGYTYEEFEAATKGNIITVVHHDDQARVIQMIAEAVEQGRNFEIQYRIRRKDGQYIWVNDIGKKGLAVDGRDVSMSVIRDISLEVASQQQLKKQAQEQSALALQYDNLFQSVLCGIVQYQLDGQQVAFKKANREAIRIFGYEPTAFWAKDDWQLAQLIAPEDRERIFSELCALKKAGDKSGYEYRLLQKDGIPCWIIGSAEIIEDQSGEKVIQSVFLDIDDRKKAEISNLRLTKQVEASNELFHLALEHTTTCEFYYSPQSRTCINPERICAYYHCQERYEQMPGSFARDNVVEADWPAFCSMYEAIHQGERTAACEFRMKEGGSWCRGTLSVILGDEEGNAQFVIGIVEDITRQKEMEEALLEARSRDSLTGLYNKESGLRLVQEHLAYRAPEEHCVMMLLDMDNFKDINQKEGKVFADAILQEVADLLRTETGTNTIQIRLGGDEFMLFFKHCNKAQATMIGPRLAHLTRGIFANSKKDIQVSVSIGMCSTEVTGDYNALYRCTESTLKYIKENDKGQAACYLDTSNELGVFLTQLYTEEHMVNAIDRVDEQRNKDIVSFALDLLGKSKNLDDAVFLLLSRVGKIYHFDRVSILEADRAFLSYHFSYQWARNRSDLQLGRDFYASEKEFADRADMYDEEGLCTSDLWGSNSHMGSCLHAAIWNYGEYAGLLSFEIDQEGHQWSREERDLLKELVKIVPSFIMKSKADAVSQAKTDFLSRMSHEIRTPMNAISGMTTIAKSVLDDHSKALDCLEKIESANTYLLGLINDILDMSRIESGKMELNYEAVDIEQLLASLDSLLLPQAIEKALELYFENGYQSKRPLWADGLRLNQVMINIIGNALKFTEKGRITVRVEELECEPRAVLRFSVRDTGVGIEPAAMTRIFNAFEQADKSTASQHGGTGLGLSISSRLVQMMGGTLEVRSEVNKGSEFFFVLSFEYAPEIAVEPVVEERHALLPDFQGQHILLAEDNDLNREIAQTILEMNGFIVECAVDGRQALEKFCASESGGFDAVLMDIRMPIMDGLEAARRIRTSGHPDARAVPIIALTANAFDEDTKKSMASGMNGHLAKPIQVEQMLEVLASCMDKRHREKV